MLITDTRGYRESYLVIRARIDRLCAQIKRGGVSQAKALEVYSEMADDFLKDDSQNAELFKMVYKSRIERLSDQFFAGAGQ